MFRIVASLGASLFAEILQQRVLANARMSLVGLVVIEKKWLLCFPIYQVNNMSMKTFPESFSEIIYSSYTESHRKFRSAQCMNCHIAHRLGEQLKMEIRCRSFRLYSKKSRNSRITNAEIYHNFPNGTQPAYNYSLNEL